MEFDKIKFDLSHLKNEKFLFCKALGRKTYARTRLSGIEDVFCAVINFWTTWVWLDSGTLFCVVKVHMLDKIMSYLK